MLCNLEPLKTLKAPKIFSCQLRNFDSIFTINITNVYIFDGPLVCMCANSEADEWTTLGDVAKNLYFLKSGVV
jgi:hypothetical protein